VNAGNRLPAQSLQPNDSSRALEKKKINFGTIYICLKIIGDEYIIKVALSQRR
jgi:hypothetical protein